MLKKLPAGKENELDFEIELSAKIKFVSNRFGVTGYAVTLNTGEEASFLSHSRTDAVETAAYMIKRELSNLIVKIQNGEFELD